MRKLTLVAAISLAAVLLPSLALAGDINAPATKAINNALSYQYPTTKCGMYYGANTMGTTSAVENAAIGTQTVQGAIGLTLGYTCPMGQAYWFVDGMFDFANLNGSQNGFSLSGPASFEQRFGFGAPVTLLASLIPGLSSLQNAVPSIIPLPAGVTVVTSNPYLGLSIHEDDISATVGLGNAREWLISTGFVLGTKTRLTDGVVFDPFVEYILPSTKLCVGPIPGGCLQRGAGLRVGTALEF